MQLFTLRRINAMRSRNELIARRYGLPAIAAAALLAVQALGGLAAQEDPARTRAREAKAEERRAATAAVAGPRASVLCPPPGRTGPSQPQGAPP